MEIENDNPVKEDPSSPAADVEKSSAEPDNFLDAFWHIASPDPTVRNNASAKIVTHCYNSEKSNTADIEYTLTRLLKGVCGGKSGVRQGFASTLTSFINARNGFNMKEKKSVGDDAREIRLKLLKATERENQGVGGERSSKVEERGSAFGRLFAILAIVRSGTFESCNESCVNTLVLDYCIDLIDLYSFKKWMRESVAFAICEIFSTTPKSIIEKILSKKCDDSEGKTSSKLRAFVMENDEGHPEKMALRLHVAKILSGSEIGISLLEGGIDRDELHEMCFIGAHSYPRMHLVFEKLLEIVPLLVGKDLESFPRSLMTDLAEGTVERKAMAIMLYQRMSHESLMSSDAFDLYRKCLENKDVLKLLFSNNEKHALSKLASKIRNDLFDEISNCSSQNQFASILYEFMPAKTFTKTFYSKMDEANKVKFVTDIARVHDLHTFAKVDKNANIVKPILLRLSKHVEDDEELTNKLFSCVNDLLSNVNLADEYFPIVNKLFFPKSSRATLDTNEKKFRFILKFHKKYGDVEYDEDLKFKSLEETCQSLTTLLSNEGENNKLIRHFSKLYWMDAVKIADTIDDAVFRTLCEAVGCVDEDNDNSDDEESGGESADLANLTLLDDDSDSEDESSDEEMIDANTISSNHNEEDQGSISMEIEHDAIADDALASMIALKQSMQKQGQVSFDISINFSASANI